MQSLSSFSNVLLAILTPHREEYLGEKSCLFLSGDLAVFMTLLDAVLTFALIVGLPLLIYIVANLSEPRSSAALYIAAASATGLVVSAERVVHVGSVLGFCHFF